MRLVLKFTVIYVFFILTVFRIDIKSRKAVGI